MITYFKLRPTLSSYCGWATSYNNGLTHRNTLQLIWSETEFLYDIPIWIWVLHAKCQPFWSRLQCVNHFKKHSWHRLIIFTYKKDNNLCWIINTDVWWWPNKTRCKDANRLGSVQFLSLAPGQNGCHVADSFESIFLEDHCILVEINRSWNLLPKLMALHLTDKPLAESMMTQFNYAFPCHEATS